VLRHDGESWRLAVTLGDYALLDVDMLSADSGWIAGTGGALFRLEAGIWRRQPSPTTATIAAIDMLTPEEGWAVGYDVYQYTSGRWRTIPNPHAGCGGGDFLNDLDLVSTNAGWAVGNCGTLLRYAGSGLSSVDSDRVLRTVGLPIALDRVTLGR